MKTHIIPTFFDAYSKLSSQEKSLTKKTLNKFISTPELKGLRFHQVNYFQSLSVNMDLRIITFLKNDSYYIVYVDHHNEAYNWAKKRKPIINGNESFFELVEYDNKKRDNDKIKTELSKTNDGYDNIVAELNKCFDDDEKLEYISSFSPHIQEILLNSLNTGTIKSLSNSQIFTFTTDNDLDIALKYPLDKWRIFLHPVQKAIAFQNPFLNVLVSGFAGTGKTVVLIHRLKYIISINSFDQIIVLLPTEELKYLVTEMLHKIIDDIPPNVKIIVPSPKKDFKYFIKNIQQSFKCHILIDEFQSFGLHYFRHFDFLIQNINCYWTILFDPAQKYYSVQFEKFINDNFIPIYLNYAYRNTKQILDYSNKYKEKYLQNKPEIPSAFYPPEPITTINGLPIKLLSTSYDKLDEIINNEVNFLLSIYEDNEIVLINNYPNDSVLQPRRIKFNYENWKIKTVQYSKIGGLEYKAGIILGGDRVKVDNREDLANAYTYISITRFRDYVILINIFSNSI
ncbi:MAG: hypothetical protein IT276_14375 [Ignavibacteriaceae bacterium]|nr:hypothetical protein [Ignavibacteriaceae bacterium]HRP93933.1 hypothetical protein [Ignavibacteriaceae bacterium]